MKTIKQIAGIALAATLAIALALSTGVAQAQGFPSRMVRITSPFPAGLTPDVIIRVIADKLARGWGQQMVIEARPGANGFIAIGAAKKAAPDGHELLLLPNAQLTLNPHLIKAIPYDPENDFVPVSMVYRTAFLVAASLVKAGRMRYLAVVGPARLESDPDVPAIGEVGGPADFEVDAGGGIVAPRGTPPELARRIAADIAKAMAEPDVRGRYRAVGFEAKASTPAEMGALIRTELRRYGDLVKRIGITSE